MIGWTAVIFAIQGWLGETPAQAAAATTPAYLQVGMAAMSLGVVSLTYASFLVELEGSCWEAGGAIDDSMCYDRPTCPFSCLPAWAAGVRPRRGRRRRVRRDRYGQYGILSWK